MADRSAAEESIIKRTIKQALGDNGVAHDSPLAKLLERDAEVRLSGGVAYVRIKDEQRGSISLGEKIEALRADFMFAHHFPKEPPTVPASDLRATSDHFDDIASGRIRVV